MIEESPEIVTQKIVNWLCYLPEGYVIRWNSDHLSPERPYSFSWVDVNIPQIEEIHSWNWTFTIVSEEEKSDDDPLADWVIPLKENFTVYGVYDPQIHWFSLEIPVFTGQLSEAARLTLDKESDRTGREIQELPSWSASWVSKALEDWAKKFAGRDDLVFTWDPTLGPSKMLQAAEEVIKTIDLTKTYEITPGVKVTEGVMDLLIREFLDESGA